MAVLLNSQNNSLRHELPDHTNFAAWQRLTLKETATNTRLILVVDNLPTNCYSSPAVSSILYPGIVTTRFVSISNPVTSAQIGTPQMSASALCTTVSPKTEQLWVCDTQAESYDVHILWKLPDCKIQTLCTRNRRDQNCHWGALSHAQEQEDSLCEYGDLEDF